MTDLPVDILDIVFDYLDINDLIKLTSAVHVDLARYSVRHRISSVAPIIFTDYNCMCIVMNTPSDRINSPVGKIICQQNQGNNRYYSTYNVLPRFRFLDTQEVLMNIIGYIR